MHQLARLQNPINFVGVGDRISTETLVLIFQFIEFHDNRSQLETAGLVCRRWRDVLLANPQFWSGTSVTLEGKLGGSPEAVKHYLESMITSLKTWYQRARGRPLTLSLFVAVSKTSWPTQLLNSYLVSEKNWAKLEFHVGSSSRANARWLDNLFGTAMRHYIKRRSPCWPMLQNLDVSSTGSLSGPSLNFNKICPKLRDLKFQVIRWQLDAEDPFPLRSLSRLELSGRAPQMTLPLFFFILQHGNNLEYLALLGLDITPEPPSAPSAYPLICHDRLRHLVVAHVHSTMSLLRKVILPSLTTFELKGPNLKEIPLDISTSQVVQELVLPTVQTLVLKVSSLHDGIFEDIEDRSLLPNLHAISFDLPQELKGHQCKWIKAFREFVERPNRCTPSTICLFGRFAELQKSLGFVELQKSLGWSNSSAQDSQPMSAQLHGYDLAGTNGHGVHEAFLTYDRRKLLYARIGARSYVCRKFPNA
ncbi:hypothetical protein EST38_g12008 [Candolleomyces aberdarensis]|uniref:Uncharacterized protein n=1 Tax=Candolleomyces aberdarensis TaxID=2316362 RepID=A0A4Q2D6Q9_9AGAR|nr:hypothetical protein EST38_g12008 [Candolleomyces aberdarensis]